MDKSIFKRSLLNVVKGVLFSLVFSVLAVLVLAIVAKYTAISEKAVVGINQVIKILALFFGILISFKEQKWGILAGVMVGLFYTVISFAVFSLVSGGLDMKNISIFDFLIGIAAGAASGVLTVNLKGMRRKRA